MKACKAPSPISSAATFIPLSCALSFLNGSLVVGALFGRLYRRLPGRNGAVKGLIFGLFGWMVMGLLFFPWLGLGVFALSVGLGIQPALFSLAMLLAYSVVMGMVYDALDARPGA